jgi:hypothetical protein
MKVEVIVQVRDEHVFAAILNWAEHKVFVRIAVSFRSSRLWAHLTV